MPRKVMVFVALAVVLAALFVRLGFWQLDRLEQRQAANATRAARLALPPVPVHELNATGSHRRAWVEGAADHEHEFVVSGRSRNGSPGVYIVTPVRPDSGEPVLVLRGWVYSPDASSVDLSRWRESRARFSGYTLALTSGKNAQELQAKGRAVRSMNGGAISTIVPYATHVLYIVSRDSAGPQAPARLPDIELTNGPHLSYAIQWFCFAAIALVGAGIVIRRARRGEPDGSTAA